MRRILVLSLIFVLTISCKNDKKQRSLSEVESVEFNIEKWPKKLIVNANTAVILDGWAEYKAIESSFESIYNIENSEDLSLIIEDLIEKQKSMAESTYPLEFNKPHIKSRQVVLKTYILKTKGNLEYRLEFQEPVIEMIEAFNALRNQFNVILNSKIDIDLIKEKK